MEKPSFSSTDAGSSLPQAETSLPRQRPERRESLPPIDLEDSRTWWFYRNSDENHIALAVSTAELWARKMQKRLAEGAELEEIWIRAFESSCEEPTDYELRLAVTVLSRSWKHGEALRQLFTDYEQTVDRSTNDMFYS